MKRKSDILKVDTKKREIKKELYTKLYEQASRKIRQAVEFGQKHVMILVPGYLLGYQPFDRLEATSWIQRQLRNGDFIVHRVEDFVLFVSWEPEKKETRVHQVSQAEEPDEEFPSFVNLKKAANKNRKYFPNAK
jgi:sugar diacid utilization regulator